MLRRSHFFPGLLLAAALMSSCSQKVTTTEPGAEPSLASLLGNAASDGYAIADKPRKFDFPADHGPHPAFRNEWWYVTGNLDSADGRRFGYELTFFRIALAPGQPAQDSSWRANQVYIAHFAVSDIANERFLTAEQFARGAAGLAGAQGEPAKVWLYDWNLRHRPAANPGGYWQLAAGTADFGIELSLEAIKAPVLQGASGWSVKSEETGSASYYYSMPRLRTTGRLRIGADEFELDGLSWLDREWSSSALGARQDGWDWFALQLDDGSELMFYQLRRDDGSADTTSAGSVIKTDGSVVPLAHSDVRVEVLAEWESPLGGIYPHGWRLSIPSQLIDLRIEPAMADQELDTFVRYWEGAVDVTGTSGGTGVSGRGYVELTGYARQGIRQ